MLSKPKRRLDAWTVVTAACTLFFLLFLVYPISRIFIQSVHTAETGFTLAYFRKFFSKPYYTNALLNSFKVTLCVTVLAALVGTPMAYILRTVQIKGKAVLEILIIISMLSPPFIGAYSWVLLLGRSGPITWFINNVLHITFDGIYGFGGILLVFTMQLYPLIYMYISGALKNMDDSLNEASESLGCVGLSRIFKVVLPLILPTLLSGCLLVFMRALADFGTPMLIGEGYRVMPVLIFNEFISEMGGNDSFAAALSVIMVIITTVLFLAQRYISGKKSFSMSATHPMSAKKATGVKNVAAHVFVYLVVGISILPQLTVAFTSFKNTSGRLFVDGYSLNSYREAFGKMGTSIVNTFVYSIAAIVLVVILGTLIAYITVRRRSKVTGALDTLTMMPYIIPGSVMGISLLMAFNKQPLMLMGTAAILIVAYVIRRLPYTIRSSSAILAQISPSVEEASISLGASHMKTFVRVTAPMMAPGVVSGAIMSWMTIISELSASVLLYVNTTKTLTIAVYTEIVRGNYGVAAALSVILTLSTVVVLLIFFRVSGNREISM
ncbi:iron ABC transporter permease [Ruminococcaceae bacterium OttesenSCG-928-L11]|nr:iron ABC transporter permease [Ruminococcaceae bacterium OttesenSCG-928-L11]